MLMKCMMLTWKQRLIQSIKHVNKFVPNTKLYIYCPKMNLTPIQFHWKSYANGQFCSLV